MPVRARLFRRPAGGVRRGGNANDLGTARGRRISMLQTETEEIMPDNDAHEALLHEIIDCELAMFLAVPDADGPSTCQKRPKTFRLMRWMSLSVHDDSTLTSYLNDLKQAGMQGRNLMVEKYARMEDSLPPLTDNPLVDVITGEEADFLAEASRLYPHAVPGRGGDAFRHYMRCELETWSDVTLALYGTEILRARNEGRNLALERYERLWRRLGYASLDEREEAARLREGT